jgi:hypothetical protein
MRDETYQLKANASITTFEFISEGPRGNIKKRIEYQEMKQNTGFKFYNLAFGDINEETNKIDDTVVSDNGDTQKVLETVASSVFHFIEKYPNAIIRIKGSSLGRTRLYRMNISNNFEEIRALFYIIGLSENGHLEPFEKNKNYLAFFIKNK